MNYPNLELLDYKTRLLLKQNEKFIKAAEKVKLNNRFSITAMSVGLEAKLFMQTWGNTGCGIDIDNNGHPYMVGDAMTNAYTVVFYESISKQYFVYFNSQLAYVITKANKNFLKDLHNDRLLSVSEARKKY
jgi:hypothetical protein